MGTKSQIKHVSRLTSASPSYRSTSTVPTVDKASRASLRSLADTFIGRYWDLAPSSDSAKSPPRLTLVPERLRDIVISFNP